MKPQNYILGLDLGTNSIGWACVDEDNKKMLDSGVRIFDAAENPKSGKSLAEPRRVARLTRRRLHRRRVRLNSILKLLQNKGFIAEGSELQKPYKGNIWELRVEALSVRLDNRELARVIYHITKNRGFKSSKKEIDNQENKELTKANADMQKIADDFESSGYKTISEYMVKTYTKEQTQKESNRCLQCECKLCMKECLMLSKYTSCPKALFTEYLTKGYESISPKIAYSCNDCSQCTLRYPHDFNIQDNFIAMRKDYVEKRGGYSDFPRHIALDDRQELECSTKYCVSIKTKNRPKFVFVPGCTVPASLPKQVELVVNHLSESFGEEVSTILRCCGRPTEMIGQMKVFKERYARVQKEIDNIDAETIVTVCPSCFKTYDTYSNRKVVTYWELMQHQIGIPKGQKNVGINSDVIFNIHDPCVTRNQSIHHESIRWVLNELGYPYEEMTYIKNNTRCCGVGGMLACVDPELHKQYNYRCVEDATQDHIVTYCGSCRGSMEKGEKDGVHILQLLFSSEPYMKADACQRGGNYGFHNRMDAKNRLVKAKQTLNIH